MVRAVLYRELNESMEEATESYFWQNAVKVSGAFVKGYIDYETTWMNKRLSSIGSSAVDLKSLIFGTSVIKNKPIVLVDLK